MRDIVFVALGSNLGDRARHLERARAAIALLADTRVLAASAVEETAPIGPAEQGPYLNQMLAIETDLTPHALLDALHEIERREGRVRRERWGPRTLDLDIVACERQSLDAGDLVIPHPALADRDFWQRELAELRGALSCEEAS